MLDQPPYSPDRVPRDFFQICIKMNNISVSGKCKGKSKLHHEGIHWGRISQLIQTMEISHKGVN